MKKRILLIPVVLVFIACGQNQIAPVTEEQKIAIESDLLNEIFDQDDAFGILAEGEPVERVLVDACIKKYKDEMLKHGFDTLPIIKDSTATVVVKQSTHYVNFRGRELSRWIKKIRNKAGGLRKIDLRIELGMYTNDYVTRYYPNDSSKLGRITVFINPYTKPQVSRNETIEPGKPFGDDGYNLGGLKP